MNQLILYLVVVKYNESTLFIAEGMLKGEMGITNITIIARGKEDRWSDAILHGYGIFELLG
jgi:hypothetical protein